MTDSTVFNGTRTEIAEWFEKYYSDIEAFGEDLSSLIHFDPAHPGTLTEDAREVVRQRCVQFLDEHKLPDGAGAVFSRSAVSSVVPGSSMRDTSSGPPS